MGGVQVGVLGPVQAQVAGRAVELGGPAPRRLLAALAASRGQAVSVDRLVDAVWDGDPVPSAVGSLQVYVSGLRKVLEPDRAPGRPAQVLVRSGPGYALRVAAADLDAERFATLAVAGAQALAAGDPAAAARDLEQALGLWRGAAYADCADCEFARPEALRLEGLRVGATEDRWDAALQTGDGARAVPELEGLLARHPLRERAAALLATALYQQGRQAEALAVLRALRERLVDELGIDPGPPVVRLEARLLAQDPGLEPVTRPVTGPGPVPGRRVPRPRTSFVGRERELAALADLLERAPLVTLTGPAGVGKTRLAVEALRRRDDTDGPWCVELAGVTDPAGLRPALAVALGLADAGAPAAALADRRTLLLLDDCEHLLDGVAELVEELLQDCPDVRVLATSREALDLPGEQLLEVRPLPAGTEAAELFRQRAQALGAAGTDDQEVVAELCRELDGLPLAVELAAAQCRVLSPRQVADLLHDRFAVLRAGSRGGREQHRTLEAAIGWSYDLLDAEQQQVFTALSVFRSPFDLVAAEAVAGRAALDALRALVGKSLLTVVPGSSPRRYAVLSSLREFGAARLGPERRSEVEAGHRTAVLRLAETADRRLRTSDGRAWLARLEEALPDVRAALAGVGTRTADADRTADLVLATDVSWFCYRRGHVAEGVGWLRTALDAAPGAPPAVRARGLVALAVLHYLTGDYTAGNALLGPAREAALAGGDEVAASSALSFSAYLRIFDGDLDGADRVAREALAEVEALHEDAVHAEQLMLLGQVLRFSGRTSDALAALERAGAVATACGHAWVTGSAGWIACKVLAEDGQDAVAADRLRDLLAFWRAEEDVTSWLVAALTLAGCVARLGDPAEGAALLGAVAALGARVGFDPRGMVQFGGPDDVGSVRTRLTGEEHDRAFARGAEDPDGVLAAASRVAQPAG